ncbi:MAG: hypothetical protein GF375_04425, partial [Candidatus Omnitrophica bacterium]|nr:hypothetical protein [Candidatus Omnitrophota bacterium]MBD3269275.1 hypothetical protein [Candidatus Omnitrophota bacterium]
MFRYIFSVNRCRNRLKVLYSRLQRNDLSVQKYRKIISRIEETEQKLASLSSENKEKLHTIKFLLKNNLLASHIDFLRKHSDPLRRNEKWLQTLDFFYSLYCQEGKVCDEIVSYILNLAPYNVVYLSALYKKFYSRHLNLRIGDNFIPSALLNEEKRSDSLGLIDYSGLRKDPSLKKIAAETVLLCNPMDGGLGSSLKRIDYLKRIWDEIKRNKNKGLRLSAKGQDLYFDVKLKGFDREGEEKDMSVKVSITELKYLQAITQADNYTELIIQEFV